jgi:CTP-dependent riboflavin kinase
LQAAKIQISNTRACTFNCGESAMLKLKGNVSERGVGDMAKRMKKYPDVFKKTTGEDFFPGTLNVKVDRHVTVKEDFRIRGTDIGEPEQDLIFEKCQINGLPAYRIRPWHLKTGKGGHGDNVLEIACSVHLRDTLGLSTNSPVEITFFRE